MNLRNDRLLRAHALIFTAQISDLRHRQRNRRQYPTRLCRRGKGTHHFPHHPSPLPNPLGRFDYRDEKRQNRRDWRPCRVDGEQ